MDRLKTQAKLWSQKKLLLESQIKHLCEEQTKILDNLELRLSGSSHNLMSHVVTLKHLHLQEALHRLFVLRHFSLTLQKEMRLSTLSMLRTDGRSLSISEQQGTEFLSELETEAELLQRYLQTVLGNALSHCIINLEPEQQRQLTDPNSEDIKARLSEAAAPSVYLTKDSLTALVDKYYSQLEGAAQRLQQHSRDQQEMQQSSTHILQCVRELNKWSRKFRSVERPHRAQRHKLKLLLQIHRDTHSLFEKVRVKKIKLEIKLEQTKDEMKGAEENFLQELAALARVSLKKRASEAEPDICDHRVDLRELLALNPGLDPALNPSLTPLCPVKIIFRDKT
ncbi:hypothetical protein WMY93_000170 [Mugilogobius chulae]|uniref:Uncharacterized protein n=1 Tax=Mugilogobius chulae TaxID=88201 RepID=A0AAW0Q996_9GOBI